MDCRLLYSGLTKGLGLLSVSLLFVAAGLRAQSPRADSLRSSLAEALPPEAQARVLTELSEAELRHDSDSAIAYAQTALRIAERIGHDSLRVAARNAIGYAQLYQGRYSDAILTLESTLDLFDEKEVSVGKAYTLNILGVALKGAAAYPRALERLFAAVQMSRELGDSLGLAGYLNNVATVYEDQNDSQTALPYYRQALSIYRKAGKTSKVAQLYTNIGVLHYYGERYDSAISYHGMALPLYERMPALEAGRISSHISLGEAHYKLGEVEKAERLHAQAVVWADSLGMAKFRVFTRLSLATDYRATGRLPLAERLIREALALADSLDYPSGLQNAYFDLYRLYKQKGELRRAYECHREMVAVLERRSNESLRKQVGRVEARFEVETALFEKRVAREEAERLRQARIARRDAAQYAGIAATVVGLLLIALFFRRSRLSSAFLGGMATLSLLLLFEFLLLLGEALFNDFSQNEPIRKLAVSIGLALLFLPVHEFLHKALNSSRA